jgi:uncharacterized OB-fold protein
VSGALRPTVHPSPESRPFWEAASRGELVIPRCRRCEQPFFYPRSTCPLCGARDLDWMTATGLGRVHAFTVQHHTTISGLRDAVPFVTAIIELDEGPRLMSFLVEVDPDPAALSCDQLVEVVFLELDDGHSLPAFRPRRTTGNH